MCRGWIPVPWKVFELQEATVRTSWLIPKTTGYKTAKAFYSTDSHQSKHLRVNILDWASRINVNVISLFISQVEAKQDFSGTAGATHSHHSHSKHSFYRSFCWCKKEHVYTFVLTLALLAHLLVLDFALADSISNVRCEALRAENETLKESCQTKCCCYFNAVRFVTRQNIPATSESRLRRN